MHELYLYDNNITDLRKAYSLPNDNNNIQTPIEIINENDITLTSTDISEDIEYNDQNTTAK